MNWSALLVAEVPPAGVVTVTSTVRPPAGAVAVIWVCGVDRERGGGGGAEVTAVAPVKPVPVMVTEVPPACGPLFGVTPVTVGAAS